ncbi:hypothetical protein [Streptomyces xanthophaeus]
MLERLDRTEAELEQSEDGSPLRLRLEASWQARFEDYIDELPAEEQASAGEWLREIITLASLANSPASPGTHSLAVGGDLNIQADNGSLAGGVLNVDGGVNLGNPRGPVTGKG